MKFSQLLVQTSHHLVTCAHHKKYIIILNKLQLFWYIHAAEMYYIHFCSLCNSITPHNLKSLVHRISHYGKCKMVDLVVINCRAYFLDISVILL